MPAQSFLFPIKDRILRAYESAIPERQDVLEDIGRRLDNIDIGDRKDSFYAIPEYSVVNVGWWAVEAIWCLAFCLTVWRPLFKESMETRRTEVALDVSDESKIAVGLLKNAVENLSTDGARGWLHGNAPEFPYEPDGTPFTDVVAAAENVFLNAVGWILLHELAHISHKHGTSQDVRSEEEEADRTATQWLFEQAPFGTVDDRLTGLTTALFYMWVREDRMGQTDHDHPPVSDRIRAALNDARVIDNAWGTCIFAGMIETYEQRHGTGEPAGQLASFDTCREYVDACLDARIAKQEQRNRS